MPKVKCERCGHEIKEKFAVIIEYEDRDNEVICRTCTAVKR